MELRRAALASAASKSVDLSNLGPLGKSFLESTNRYSGKYSGLYRFQIHYDEIAVTVKYV